MAAKERKVEAWLWTIDNTWRSHRDHLGHLGRDDNDDEEANYATAHL